MNPPINQLVPKFRRKLTDCTGNAKGYDDKILAECIKTVIRLGKLEVERLIGDGPQLAENSKEEQQLILEACLFLLRPRCGRGGIPNSVIEKLETELFEIKNGDSLFSGR